MLNAKFWEMGFYIDFEQISLDALQASFESVDLLPSRQLIKEDIQHNFEVLKDQGLSNAAALLEAIKTPKKTREFAMQSGLDLNYLTILSREMRSYLQKPTRLKDFPGIPKKAIVKLENSGIKNAQQLFDRVLTSENRRELCAQTGIDTKLIPRLTKLVDLSRIRWVNHTFANMLYEAGYDSAEKVAQADYTVLHQKVKKLNEERAFFKGSIGLHDMKLCVEAAKDVSLDIEYDS
jgi:hypothetical protein